MKTTRKLSSFILTLVIVMGIITCPIVSHDALAFETTGNKTFDAFIRDSRFENGASYGNIGPHLSSWDCSQCCAYCADYVKFCYGSDSPWSTSVCTRYYNVNEIRAGDVILVGNGDNGNGHWFVCLKRDGNRLYVAEGNYQKKVRIGWNYSISDGKILGTPYGFTRGHHYGTPLTVNQAPVGCVDVCEINDKNQLRVAGWALDLDQPSKSLSVHIYVNDQFCFAVDAKNSSPDVNKAFADFKVKGKHRFDTTYDLRVKGNITVDVYAIDTQNGTNPHLGDHPYSSKRFTLSTKTEKTKASGNAKLKNGNYRIASATNTNMYVSVTPNQYYKCGNIALFPQSAASQTFKFTRNTDGSYTISSGSYVLDVAGFAYQGNVQLYSSNNSQAQRWRVVPVGNGLYKLVNGNNCNLDVFGNQMVSGTNIHTWKDNGTTAQLFKLEKV